MTSNTSGDPMVEIDRALEEIRPYIASHRGSVEVVDFDPDSGVVYVRLGGTCHGCSAATVTLKMGIEQRLKQVLPSVTSVEAV